MFSKQVIKTTTVQLVEAMAKSAGIRAIACGNIGLPVLDAIREPEGFDLLVVELSSFQLHYLGSISPVSAVVLNVANDHLDWHGGFEAYKAAKAKVYENTVAACVYNVMDKSTESMVEDADVVEGARAIGFTLGIPTRSQVGFVEDILCDRAFLDDRANNALEIATLEDLAQIGVLTPHLMANAAAATALARSAGVEPADIREAIRNFRLDAHRIELVAEANGVRWIDDSKATNAHAADASSSASPSPSPSAPSPSAPSTSPSPTVVASHAQPFGWEAAIVRRVVRALFPAGAPAYALAE